MDNGEKHAITIEVDAVAWRRLDLVGKDQGLSPQEVAQACVEASMMSWEQTMHAAWQAYRTAGGVKDFVHWLKFRRMLGGRLNG